LTRLRAAWLEQRSPSRLRSLVQLPLAPAAWLVAASARLRRHLHRRGVLPTSRLPSRVVSVGDLMLGGTGKTPMAAWIAVELRRRGHKVVLASRGAGRRGREKVRVVSDGRFVHGEVASAGDEPMLLAAAAPGVPVLVGRDLASVGLRALSAFGADILVLDDGFQQHRVERDVNLVMFDGGFGLGNRQLFPRGPLRESLATLRHAHAIGVVDGPLPAADAACIERYAHVAYRFRVVRQPLALRPLAGGRGEPPEMLAGRAVGLLSGLACPGGFRRTLESLDALVVAERRFRNHHRYRRRDLLRLDRDAPLWVTTEKDALKISPAWAAGVDVRVLVVEMQVEAGDALGDWLEARLR
jgi:tetraacyldisaccharide 4'-kinase